MTRCDKIQDSTAAISSTTTAGSPSLCSASLTVSPTLAHESRADERIEETDTTAVVTTPVIATPLHDLASREPASQERERRERCISYTLHDAVVPPKMMPRDMVDVMQTWKMFQDQVL